MKCPKCGYLLPEDSEYCQYCGTHLDFMPSSDIPTEETDVPMEAEPPTALLVNESVSNAIPVIPQPEATRDASLFHRAYNAYLSNDPDKRCFFEELLGSEELKTAYLEERDRVQREYDKGIRVSFEPSYSDFMCILHDKYTKLPQQPQVSYEKSEPITEPIVPAANQKEENATSLNRDRKHTFCKKCGAAIEPSTKKCSGCGKRYFRAKTTIPLVLLAVLLVASVGLNTMQYLQGKAANETVKSQMSKIEKLERTVAGQEDTIFSLQSTISSLKNTISSQKSVIASLDKKRGYFDTICKELSSGNLGSAESNFKASESIIVVEKNEKNRKFTLTANWTNGGSVSVNYSDYAATISFDNDTWTTSTKMTVLPWYEGVTAVTFSNDVNSKTFKILIIVI